MDEKERAAAADVVGHALDLPRTPRGQVLLAVGLDQVRPVASAGTIGDAIRAVAAAPNDRALRRALAELDALVNRAAHGRTKRGERANLVALIVLLCRLDARLELLPGSDVRAVRRRLDQLMAG